MDCIAFNKRYIPNPFGFKNLGVTCYFNALIQGLITCTSLIEVCIKNKHNDKFTSNPVMVVFISMIDLYYDGENIINLNDREENKNKLLLKSPELWYSMKKFLKKIDRQTQFGQGQEDSYEAFIILMQCWENIDEIRTLFEHIYHANYICADCKQMRFSFNYITDINYKKIIKKRNENLINMSKGKKELINIENKDESWIENNTHFIVTSDLTSGNADTIKNKFGYIESNTLQKYIECPKGILEGINCFNCNSKKDKLKYSSLAILPEILIIVIKKFTFNKRRSYGEKTNIDTSIPKKLIFNAQSGKTLIYEPIVQIMHAGETTGGHYYTHAIRNNFKYNEYQWFNLNDISIFPIQDFKSNTNSYTVIYHIMP